MKKFYEFNSIARFVFLGLALFMVVWNIFAFFLTKTEQQFDTGMVVMFAFFVFGRICDIWSASKSDRIVSRNEFWEAL